MATNDTESGGMKPAEPQKEHLWLRRLVGEWAYEFEVPMGPDQPPEKITGTETVRSLGDLWFVGEGKGPMPGGDEGTTVITLGYDPQKGRFVGTWIGSMMTYLWVYDGELDEAGKVLTLHAKGPDMAGEGKMVPYKDVITLESDDHRVLRSHAQGDDGEWSQIMEAHYRRKG